MDLIIDPAGNARTIYSETIDLAALGPIQITRASHVEPTAVGQWTADMELTGGPVLGPFDHRSEALSAEHAWLEANWLVTPA